MLRLGYAHWLRRGLVAERKGLDQNRLLRLSGTESWSQVVVGVEVGVV